MWSADIPIHNPQLFQVRHPSTESSLVSVGKFGLSDVSITVKRGVRLVSMMTPTICDYRLLNLCTVPIAFAQCKYDGPFEVLKAFQKIEKDEEAIFDPSLTSDVERLYNRSLGFNLYVPSGPKALDFWIVLPSKYRRKGAKTKTNDRRHETSTPAADIIREQRQLQSYQQDILEEGDDAENVKTNLLEVS